LTEHARAVLSDCRDAVAELTDDLQGSMWRRRWATVITLLRAVGHVLDKVDGSSSPEMRSAIDAAWQTILKTKPDPVLFWGFIEEDRNLLLKEYRFVAGQGVTIFAPPMQVKAMVPGRPTTASPIVEGRSELVYKMSDGPFKDQDPRDVARRALDWLENYLGSIDADAAPRAGRRNDLRG
jgi:hypothetical protein